MSKKLNQISNIIILIYLCFHLLYTIFMFTQSIVYGFLWLTILLIELLLYFISVKKVKFLKIILAIFLLIQSCLSLVIFTCGSNSNTKNADYVLVLGYQLDHDQMTKTLQLRLDKAYEYSLKNPESQLVLCGGITRENTISEAQVMADYLMKKGVSLEKITLEDQSTDTIENIQNSLDYIEKDSDIVILSSNYHVYRAKLIAKKAGIEAKGIGSSAPIVLIPNQLLFEKLGILLLSVK